MCVCVCVCVCDGTHSIAPIVEFWSVCVCVRVCACVYSIAPIVEFCDVCVTSKGIYVKPGLNPPIGERKLYLLIEGDAERKVKNALAQVDLSFVCIMFIAALPPPDTLAHTHRHTHTHTH